MNTPTDWDGPVFLMNFPLSVSNTVANNAWMDPEVQGRYDKKKAALQWFTFYRELSNWALVYVLPGHGNFQDLPFVANLGCYLPHSKEHTILLSNFTSQPRKGEDVIGMKFFESFDYRVIQPPHCWEGEADLKWVRDNIYIGGSGIRSTKSSYHWMHKTFGMNIVDIDMIDPKMYHLDCVYLQLTDTKALVNVSVVKHDDIKRLEKYVEIIAVPKEFLHEGWTNSICVGDVIFNASVDTSSEFEKLIHKHGFDLKTFDLSEFYKSGADLSCLCMHLNYKNRF